MAEHQGTVVKTIGDAVMAAFVREEDAVRAGAAMHAGFRAFRQSEADAGELSLKVGVFAGPCYVVTANGRERSVVPARAMEDVFSEIKRQSQVDARWISVNLKAMSIDHEPASDFEKKAAREIADGKSELDVVEDGYYRRAGAIPLSSGCVSCHAGLFKEATQTPKYAALVISVPIISDSGKPK